MDFFTLSSLWTGNRQIKQGSTNTAPVLQMVRAGSISVINRPLRVCVLPAEAEPGEL